MMAVFDLFCVEKLAMVFAMGQAHLKSGYNSINMMVF